MKKYLFFFFLLLISCKKEKRYCYDCDLFTYNNTTQTYDKNYREYCDKTEDEITTIIRQHSVRGLEWMECTKRAK